MSGPFFRTHEELPRRARSACRASTLDLVSSSISSCPRPDCPGPRPPSAGARACCGWDAHTAPVTHHDFSDLPGLLAPGDLLVVNDTRVFPARLLGRRLPGGGAAECFLVQPGRRARHLGGAGASRAAHEAPARAWCSSATGAVLQAEVLGRGTFTVAAWSVSRRQMAGRCGRRSRWWATCRCRRTSSVRHGGRSRAVPDGLRAARRDRWPRPPPVCTSPTT
jgi:hypothetical protein